MVWQLWANYEEKPTEEVAQLSEEKERVANYKPVYVTEITDGLHFYTQDVETGKSWATVHWLIRKQGMRLNRKQLVQKQEYNTKPNNEIRSNR